MKSRPSFARPVLYTIFFIVLFAIEYVIIPVRVFEVCPRYLLCGVVALGMYENEKYSVIFGLIFGLLADFACGGLFGLNAIVLICTGFAVSYLVAGSWRRTLLNAFVVTGCVTVLFDVFVLLTSLLRFDSGTLDIPGALLKIMLPKLLLTLAANIPIYFVFKKVAMNKKWRSYDEIYY